MCIQKTEKGLNMSFYMDEKGRGIERKYYHFSELDNYAENVIKTYSVTDNSHVLYPLSTDFLTILIEKYVDDLDLYYNMHEKYPDEVVEGVTIFRPCSKPSVLISEQLQNNENRLRTTLSHELGHVILHNPLWQTKFRNEQLNLSQDYCVEQVCKRENITSNISNTNEANYKNYDWMEWQANYFGCALLMPKSEVINTIHNFIKNKGILTGIYESSSLASELISIVAKKFQVSFQAAMIRLKVLNTFVPEVEQNIQPSLF